MTLNTYKDTASCQILGIESLPSHWSENKLGYLFNLGKGLTVTKQDLCDEGVPCLNYGEIHSKYGFEVNPNIHRLKCVSQSYLKSNPNALIQNGDFVFADTSEDIEGSGNFSQLISTNPTLAGYHTIIVRPVGNVFPRFFAYVFHSEEFRNQIRLLVKGVKVLSISQNILKSTSVWLPTKGEQQKIAQFLDYETAKIDALIDEQKRLIELLKEKRQAVISHAVTKGLNPDVPMKDSGVEWLGEVPEHWTIGKINHLVSSVSNGTTAAQIDESLDTLAITRIETISTGQINYEKVGYIENTKCIEPFLLQKGDILFSHINSLAMIGNVAIYEESQPLVHGMNLLRLKPERSVVNSYWLLYFLKSKIVRQAVESRAKPAINQASISTGSIKELAIPLISLEEQTKIASYINYETMRIDRLDMQTNKSIQLMKERRSALISAAVTGKIDVRDWQPPKGSDRVESQLEKVSAHGEA
ncbi:hypothetical protein BFR57_05995 [Idiomarina sp. MD25a]|uniref:restriction endonuclease subunit S n=1 Tax=Idiomarina sp. MD25a TaxID=1889913 RepID=UPI0008F89F11|nr:restriction endonuclease subunit S [Idiomarina sp. MD25a]OIN01538.1 hypothetical protein BFR57_05995 [Idiomarina sp. MD25a]